MSRADGTIDRFIAALLFAAFILTIPLANFLIGNVGATCIPSGPCLVPVGFGMEAPSGVLVVGVALLLRDAVQERLGKRWSLGAVGLGAGLSFALADPAIAVASTAAFAASELADFSVYNALRERSRPWAMAASNALGALVDSGVFLWLAFGSLAFMEGQVFGKLLATAAIVPAWALWRSGRSRRA